MFKPLSEYSSKQNKYIIYLWVLFYLVLFWFFLARGVTSWDPDFGWHLRAGSDMLSQGTVYLEEERTIPSLGEEWVNHEWLLDIFFYLFYTQIPNSYFWLAVLFSLMTVGSFMLLAFISYKYFYPFLKKNLWGFLFSTIFLQILGAVTLIPSYGIRPQVFSWLFFLVLWMLLFLVFRDQKRLKYLIFLPLFFWFWANWHGTFVLGLGIFLIFFFYYFISSYRQSKFFQDPILRPLTLVVVISFLVTLFTPYGWELWELVVKDYSQSTVYLDVIVEWLPIYKLPISWPSFPVFILFVFLGGIYLRDVYKKGDMNKVEYKSPLIPYGMARGFLNFYSFLVIIFLFLSIEYRRFLPLSFFLFYPFLFFLWARFFVLFQKLPFNKLMAFLFSFLFGILILSFASQIAVVSPQKIYEKYPVQAVNFLPTYANSFVKATEIKEATAGKQDTNSKSTRMFNYYGWGGYLNWFLPEQLIFVDGRMPQKVLANGNSYIEEYRSFLNKDLIEKKLDEYEINLVLWPKRFTIYKKTPEWEKAFLIKFFPEAFEEFMYKDRHLIDYLENNWEKIYEDEVSLIYKRE